MNMPAEIRVAEDVCALPLARRLAAMLDRDPALIEEGSPLPHGWHVILFNDPTLQSALRADGAGALGVSLPEIGLPRLMLGGRQNHFAGEIPVGARVRRESRAGDVQVKTGRSGRFALVKVEHRLFVADAPEPVLVEHQDFVLREAEDPAKRAPAAAVTPPTPQPTPTAARTLIPDERLLFRYSAITDNPHRIHYDFPYATGAEGYPRLVVNGSIPAMFLLELFRHTAGREPLTFSSRNVAPMFCGASLHLNALEESDGWRLWATNDAGELTFDARAT